MIICQVFSNSQNTQFESSSSSLVQIFHACCLREILNLIRDSCDDILTSNYFSTLDFSVLSSKLAERFLTDVVGIAVSYNLWWVNLHHRLAHWFLPFHFCSKIFLRSTFENLKITDQCAVSSQPPNVHVYAMCLMAWKSLSSWRKGSLIKTSSEKLSIENIMAAFLAAKGIE